MDKQAADRLLKKYLDGSCSAAEQQLVERWLDDAVSEDNDWSGMGAAERERLQLSVRNRLIESIGTGGKRDFRILPLMRSRVAILSAAAAILVLVGLALFFFKSGSDPVTGPVYANDIAPGSNKATLRMGNGKVIALSGNKKGVLIDATKLTYDDGSEITEQTAEVQELVVQTPNGGQYEAVLPDGTHVWLNAASTLKFPSKFIGKERLVTLSGEAYFEVSHDKSKPFKVVSAGQTVEVLGTHFNINAYQDNQAVKTTLLEGSVRLSGGSVSGTVLKPNQSASFSGGKIRVERLAPEEAENEVAWKDGLFIFEDESLQSVMNKVARWYNVEVVYTVGVDKNELYGGSLSRYDKVSKVLETLELTKGIHFKVEGRRILVMK